jgi:hypothetical protein
MEHRSMGTEDTTSEMNTVFEIFKQYFETKPCCLVGLRPLKERVEIFIVLRSSFKDQNAPSIEAVLFRNGAQNVVERRSRPSSTSDVQFEMTSTAVHAVAAYDGNEVGQFGSLVVQQILAGEVRIKITGGFFALMSNGYLGIIKAGGSDFLKLLAQHGFSSLSKFPEIIKKLRQ